MLAPEGWLELVADALALGPCTSVAFGRPSLASDPPPAGFDYVRTFVIDTQDTPELRASLQTRLAGLAEATGAAELTGLHARFSRLPPEDYATSWKKTWKPFRVAGFALVPRDHSKPLRATDQRLVMEPGGAFGTGRPSDDARLLARDRAARAPNDRVLDAGFGNGVLAVACALRGAREIVAFDIDAAALPYAELLAADNGVTAACRWRIGGFECLGPADLGFDGVCANLFADLIQGHAADLARALRPGGWFAISGCRADYRDATLQALSSAGLVLEERSTRGRWDTYVGVRAGAGR